MADHNFNLKNENYTETMFDISGFAQYTMPAFNIGLDADYKKQILTNDYVAGNRLILFLPSERLD